MIREAAINDLATHIVDGMDIKSCVQLCIETIENNLDNASDNEIEQEYLELTGDTIVIDGG